MVEKDKYHKKIKHIFEIKTSLVSSPPTLMMLMKCDGQFMILFYIPVVFGGATEIEGEMMITIFEDKRRGGYNRIAS